MPGFNPNPNRRKNIKPGLNVPAGLAAELEKFLQSVKEHLQGADGAKGQPKERFVTLQDLKDLGLARIVTINGRGEPRALDSVVGDGSSSSGESGDIDNLDGVTITAAADGDVLRFVAADDSWANYNFFESDGIARRDRLPEGVAYWDESETVTEAWTFSATLDVTGAATFASTLDVTGAVGLGDTLDVVGAVTLDSTLDVLGATTIDDTLNVTGAVTLDSTLDVLGATTIDDTLHATGAVTLDSTLTLGGNLITASVLTIAGTGETLATFTDDGAVVLYHDNVAKLDTKSDGVNIVGELEADSLDIDGAGDVSGILTAAGVFTLSTTGFLTINHANPAIELFESDGGTDDKLWRIIASGERLSISAVLDDGTSPVAAIAIDRTNTTIDEIDLTATEVEFNVTTFDMNGALDLDATVSQIANFASNTTGFVVISSPDLTRFFLQDTTAGANLTNWAMFSFNGQFGVQSVLDDLTGGEIAWGATHNSSNEITAQTFKSDQFTFTADTEFQLDGAFDLNGNLTVPSGWTLTTEGGTFTIAGTGETLATFADDGAVTLYHNNTSRLATSATGVDVVAGLLLTVASASGGAGFRLPHGAAPSSPTNGDMWTTTAGLFVRINGATVGPLS